MNPTNVAETYQKPDFDNGKIGAEAQLLKVWKLEQHVNQN